MDPVTRTIGDGDDGRGRANEGQFRHAHTFGVMLSGLEAGARGGMAAECARDGSLRCDAADGKWPESKIYAG
jgi:hypothetical protein